MFAQIQFRRDTISGWNASSSVILSEGELGLEYPNSSFLLGTSDSIRFKLGDGVHTWSQLPYYKSTVSQLKDVSFSSLNDKHIIIYNSSSNDWENISTSSFNSYMSFINLKDVSGSYAGNQGKILQVGTDNIIFIDTSSFLYISDFNSFTSSINNYISNLNLYTQSSNVNFDLLNIHSSSVNAWTSSFSSSINTELYTISSSYNTTITNLSSSLDNRINNISASGATSFLDLNDTPNDYSSILTGSLSLNTLVQVSPTGGLIFVYDDKYIDYSKFGTFTSSYINDSSSFNNRITNNSSSAYSSIYDLSSSAYQSLYSSSNELSSSIYSLSSSNDTRIYNLSSSISNSFMIISASIPRTLGQLWDTALGTPINNYVLTYNSSLAKWIPQAPSGGGGSGSLYFINLLDAPTSSYTGSAGKIIQVRYDETGLEFLSTQSFINSFTGSLNIPRYIGDLRDVETGSAIEDDVLKWNASLHKWIPGTPLLFSRFIELEDVPNSYTASSGYALVVNPTENGIVFAPISGISGSYTLLTEFRAYTSSIKLDSASFDNRIISMSENTTNLQTVLNNGSIATLASGSFILNSTGSANKIYLETGEGNGNNSYLDMNEYGNINLRSYQSGTYNISELYISKDENRIMMASNQDNISSNCSVNYDRIELDSISGSIENAMRFYMSPGNHHVKFFRYDVGSQSTNAGIEYGDDYSSYFTSRSLVDRGFVLNAITSSKNTTNLQTVLNNGSVATLVSGSFILSSTGSANKIYLETGEGSGSNKWNTYLDMKEDGNIYMNVYSSDDPSNIYSNLRMTYDDMIELMSKSYNQNCNILIYPDQLLLQSITGSISNVLRFDSTDTNQKVTFYRSDEPQNTNAGIEYGDDYSSYFTSRSLVDKGYVLNTISSSHLRSITYDNLLNNIYSGSLIPTQYYLITDHRTIYKIPETTEIASGTLEPLIVRSNTSNSLDINAFSYLYPNDIIYYDVFDSSSEDGTWNNENQKYLGGTLRTGKITYRKDTKYNLECYYDWRNIKFRRWKVEAEGWISGNIYSIYSVASASDGNIYVARYNTSGSVDPVSSTDWQLIFGYSTSYNTGYLSWTNDSSSFTIGNINPQNFKPFISYQDFYTFTITNELLNSSGIINNSDDGLIGSGYTDIHIGKVDRDYIKSNVGTELDISYNNIVLYMTPDWEPELSIQSNHFNHCCYNSTICGNYFSGNTINQLFSSNIINLSFQNNNIGIYFRNNIIGPGFNYNNIKYGFNTNIINNYMNYNNINQSMTQNIIGQYFIHNTIGDNFMHNTISSSFEYNIIGDNFAANTNHRIIGTTFAFNNVESLSSTDTNEWIIGDNFKYNTIKARSIQSVIDFTNATHVYNDYDCTIMKVSGSTTPKLSFYDSTGNIHITDVTD